MKTTSSTAFMIGMKSGNILGIGQKLIPFRPGNDPYGFVRDGQWHLVEIPMSDMATDVDLFEVSQLFQILGTSGPISDIEIDDIYFSGGGEPRRQASVRVSEKGGVIDFSFLTDHLTNYRILYKDTMDDPRGISGSTVAGDGTVKTVSELAPPAQRFYWAETIR
jgi:hypothetical protein